MVNKLTKKQVTNRVITLNDTSKSVVVRTKAHKELRDSMMNPSVNFDPKTFDPMEGADNHSIIKRVRVPLKRRLPNVHRMNPKEIIDGQMIGMFESKQDLYLMIAWLSERVSDLEDNSI